MRTARRAARLRSMGVVGRAPLVAVGGAFDVSVLLARSMGRAAGRTFAWAGRHPWIATTTGIAAMGGVGATRGVYAAARNVQSVPPTNKPLPPTTGPGYNVWGGPRMGPMSPSNLGATGDLTLSLHRLRHR